MPESRVLDWPADLAACLRPTPHVNSDHPAIAACAQDIAPRTLPARERAVRVFEFVRDHIEYEFHAKTEEDLYIASHILEIGRGFCVQKAVLQCALARAAGVPSAIVFAALRDQTLPPRVVEAIKTDTLEYHGLGAFHVDGQWLRADATLSPALVARKGYRLVAFDGTTEGLLAPTTLDGQPHITYTRWMGVYADLPVDTLLPEFRGFYRNADPEAVKNLQL